MLLTDGAPRSSRNPVANICITGRLVVTALLFLVAGGELISRVFRDFAGFAMMPVAIMMLVCELWTMSRPMVEVAPGQAASR